MTHRIDHVGKFEIIERLGEGNMGEVYLARDTIIGREVTLKIVRWSALPPADGQGRFLREAQWAARFSHPNLVTVHEAIELDGMLVLVMDHVPGPDLGTLIQQNALTPKEALGHLAQVCDGLAHMHHHGVLHLNLKPSNIRMGRVSGRPAPKILDAGFTRRQGVEPGFEAAFLDSLAYSAPESLPPGKPDGRADLFSVGVILYEALSGRHPFRAETQAETLQRVRQEEPPALDLNRFPDLSPALQTVLNQVLAKDPNRRHLSAEALAATLRAARDPVWTPETDKALATKPFLPQKPAKQAKPRGRSTGMVWGLSAGALMFLVLVGLYWTWARHRAGHSILAPTERAAASPNQTQPAPPAPESNPATPPTPEPTPPTPVPPSQPASPQPPVPPAPSAPTPPPEYANLDAATDGIDKDPKGVLLFLDRTLATSPDDERAIALRIVALYNLGQYGECSKAIRNAREAGHALWAMAQRQPPLMAMLQRDANSPHLPRRKPAAPPQPEPAPTP